MIGCQGWTSGWRWPSLYSNADHEIEAYHRVSFMTGRRGLAGVFQIEPGNFQERLALGLKSKAYLGRF
jgi:hypothetical protein